MTRRGRLRPRQAAPDPASGPGTEQDAARAREAAESACADLDQARDAAQRQVRQDATRDQADLRALQAKIVAAGDARAARQPAQSGPRPSCNVPALTLTRQPGRPPQHPRPGTPPPALAGKLSDEQLAAQNIPLRASGSTDSRVSSTVHNGSRSC